MMDIRGLVNAYQLDVAPRQALVDEPVSIRVSQAQPGQKLTIRASAIDELDKRWQSYAVFTADEQGVVDVGRKEPEAGSYEGVDGMGLFWSMRRVEKGKQRDAFFAKNTTAPLTVTIEMSMTRLSPGGGVTIDFGGSSRVNTEATVDSWGRILGFLRGSLREDTIERVQG